MGLGLEEQWALEAKLLTLLRASLWKHFGVKVPEVTQPPPVFSQTYLLAQRMANGGCLVSFLREACGVGSVFPERFTADCLPVLLEGRRGEPASSKRHFLVCVSFYQ